MPTTGVPRSRSAAVRWEPMKPAAPVTSAFTRTPHARAPAAGTAGRRVERGMHGAASRGHAAVRQPPHLVGELHPDRRQQAAFGPHLELVIVLRGAAVLAVRLDHRQRYTRMLHLPITPSQCPQQIGARHLEPHEVVRVVDDPHLVGLGVANADGRGRCRHRAHCGAVMSAAARRSRIARARSGCRRSRCRRPASSRQPRRPGRRWSCRCRRPRRYRPDCRCGRAGRAHHES